MSPHPTKSGPGRRHGHAVPHARKPVDAKGAWAGLHRATKVRAARRVLVGQLGIRQAKKFMRAAKGNVRGVAIP